MAYAIRPLLLGEIVDTGIRLVRNHYGLMLGIAAAGYGPVILFQVWAATNRMAGSAAVPPPIVGLLTILISVVAVPFITAALNMALCDVYVGRPTRVGTTLRRTASILPQIVGTMFWLFLILTGGLLLLVIPGIWLMFAYILYAPIMVEERVFGRAALRRSRALMDGSKRRAAMIIVPLMLAMYVASIGSTIGVRAWPLVQAAAPGIVGICTAPFFAAIIVVFYFDVRCRREAFDLEHLAQLVEQRDAAPLPAA